MTARQGPTPDRLTIGHRIPPLEIVSTLEDLVRWSAAADDYTTFHFDPDAAAARGFDGPVVHGTFQAAQIARMLTSWLGPRAQLTDLACRYRHPVLAGDPMVCGAEITTVESTAEDHAVSFDVWVESPAGRPVTVGTASARVPAAEPWEDGGLITDELLAAFRVGETIGRYTFHVTAERIRRFAGVLADLDIETRLVAPGADQESAAAPTAPTTFFAALDPLELKIMSHDRGLHLIPYRRTGGGNAFNEIEYDRPIRAGDTVTAEVAYTDVYERSGRSGPLLFRVRQTLLTDANGERIGVSRSGHVYSFDVPSYRPPQRSRRAAPPDPDAAGELLPPLTRTPTTQTLVWYAAAADDYAPLHYDHTYARTRGFDGVIVHGFLKAGYMATMLESWAGPEAFVKRFRAEYRGPDYPDRPITCRGRVLRSFEEDGKQAVEVALWTERADGSVSTRGSATVHRPA